MPRADAGYTATEALAALLIVGLAVGGLHAGMLTLTRSQDGVTRDTRSAFETRRVERALGDFLAPYGPFRLTQSDVFSGAAQGFSFLCGAVRCTAELRDGDLVLDGPRGPQRLPLPGLRSPSFVYASQRASASSWPWAVSPSEIEKLRTVSIVDMADGVASPLAIAHLWVQQEPDCEFDTISRDCRRQIGS